MREQIVSAAAARGRLTKRERIQRAQRLVESTRLQLDRALVRYRIAESQQLATQHLERMGGATARDVDAAKARTLEVVGEVGAANSALCDARQALADARATRRDRR